MAGLGIGDGHLGQGMGSHNEILGSTPSATASEVGADFRQGTMSLFAARPMPRWPSSASPTRRCGTRRRRAYDASSDLLLLPSRASRAVNSAPFIGSALEAMLVEERLPPSSSRCAVSAGSACKADQDRRRLAEDDPRSSARNPELRDPPQEEPRTLVRRSEAARLLGRENAVEWSRTGIAIGGVVVFVAVLGAVAGWSGGLVDQAQQRESPGHHSLAAREIAAPCGDRTTVGGLEPGDQASRTVPTRRRFRGACRTNPAAPQAVAPRTRRGAEPNRADRQRTSQRRRAGCRGG